MGDIPKENPEKVSGWEFTGALHTRSREAPLAEVLQLVPFGFKVSPHRWAGRGCRDAQGGGEPLSAQLTVRLVCIGPAHGCVQGAAGRLGLWFSD